MRERARLLNSLIKSRRAEELQATGFGRSELDSSVLPLATDSQGRMILSPGLDIAVQSSNLDIRNLAESSNGVSITVSNLDIRDLDGSRDSLVASHCLSVINSESGSVPILSTAYFLATNVGAHRQNTFYVSNVSGIVVGVTVALEIAPADIDSYYVAESSSFSLLGGETALLSPGRLMKYARVRVSALLALANITVYYFGRA